MEFVVLNYFCVLILSLNVCSSATVCRDALGMECGTIHDVRITASSMYDPNHAPSQARLNFKAGGGKYGSWSAKINDALQWLQVDLLDKTSVTRIATQGREDTNQWVTSFSLMYSNDGRSFQNHNKGKIFRGNNDRNTVVEHVLTPSITARYIRIVPITWSAHISMRMELYGCTSACIKPLGLACGIIPAARITASSMFDQNHAPSQARLHFKAGGGKTGSWSAKINDALQWLQVDLGQITKVTRIATQGRDDMDQWVTSYRLEYSYDGQNFYKYKDGRNFVGNRGRNTVVEHVLTPAIAARYIRIVPKTWNRHISMRMELYGCSTGCKDALGMKDGAIITASSMYDPNHAPSQARLNFKAGGGKTGSWSAKINDALQWLQVDLGQITKVTRIATQGRDDMDQWVTSYSLMYSNDGRSFQNHNKGKILQGSTDRNTVVEHVLTPAIAARYIRIVPKTWNRHISMRMEFYGC